MTLEIYVEKAVMLVESGYSIIEAVNKVTKEYKRVTKSEAN